MMVLAGDIGGTSTRLAFFTVEGARLRVVKEEKYASRSHGSLNEIVREFVGGNDITATHACFGIAGPVRGGCVHTPNLAWDVDAGSLAADLGLEEVALINDLSANAYGIDLLEEHDFAVLNKGVTSAGTIAVVSAGTGLGEAVAYWDGTQHRPLPSEAGHADFAPRNELEVELLLYLRARHGRVSYERLVSGPGLRNIYHFLRDTKRGHESPQIVEEMQNGDPSAVISRAALEGRCPLCEQALDLFVSLYGAEAGNAALRFLAIGGVHLGGGIAPKIIEKLKGPTFMVAFTAKGRLSSLLETIPVRVILNDRTALLGAGRCAALRAAGEGRQALP